MYSERLEVRSAVYAGELVWREREARLHQIHDALPIPTWLPYLSKYLSLLGVLVVLQAVLLVCGVLIQVFKGYFHFELGLYFQELFVLRMVDYAILSALAFAIHAVVNHKYVGHLVMVVYFLLMMFAGQLGIASEDIEWVETISDNREPFLQEETVDLVIASYSITDERRQVVGQAGPYYVTGQSLLVAADDDSIKGPDDLDGKKVCSVTGSTSIATVEEEYGADPVGVAFSPELMQEERRNGTPTDVLQSRAWALRTSPDLPSPVELLS